MSEFGVSFVVRGIPMPKGSTTRMPHGATIPAGTAASRKRMAQWYEDIRHEARQAFGERPPYVEAVRLYAEFVLLAPRSMPKYQHGWLPHTKKPDVDKLLRGLCDALTGIAWRDDSQVCVAAINKTYAWDGATGVVVGIEPIDEARAKRMAAVSQHLRAFVMEGDE